MYASAFSVSSPFLYLICGAIAEGITSALFSGNNDALIYDSLYETGRTGEYSLITGRTRAMYQVALSSSALIGGILSLWSFELIFWFSIIPQLINFIVSLQMTEPSKHWLNDNNSHGTSAFRHLKKSFSEFKNDRIVRSISTAEAIDYGIGESLYELTPAFVATLWPAWAIGIAKMLGHCCSLISYWFADNIIRRFSAIDVLIKGKAASLFLSFTGAAFPSPITPLLFSLSSLSFGVGSIAVNNVVQAIANSERRATILSIKSMLLGISFAVNSFLLGMLIDYVGMRVAFCMGLIVSASSIFIFSQLRNDKLLRERNKMRL